jgi:hypothetical protein
MSAVASQSPADQAHPAAADEVQPWELHSELVLVSPEVCRRALEELPERDPDAFLTRWQAIIDARPEEPGAAKAIARHTLWRVRQTASFGLVVVGVILALALLAELWH